MAKRTSKIKLDFSGVEARVLVKEGEYLVKVAEVTKEKGDKADYFKWKFEIADGKFEGSALYYNTSLSEKSLWNLKSLLEALGVDLPDETFELDLTEMVDLELNVTVEHDTYESKKQSKIVDFWAADGEKDDGEDDDKGKKKSKKDKKGSKKSKKTAEKPDEDAVNDMDEDELKEVIEEHSLEIDPDDFPKVKALRKEVIKALEDAGDGEEEEKPKGKGKKKKKGGKKKDAVDQDAINEMDEDELEAFNEEHELKVKLSKYKTLRKKQAAVIDAGTEAGVVED